MADALADCLLSFRLLKVGGTLIIDDEANFRDVAAATAALESALGGGLQILHREVLPRLKQPVPPSMLMHLLAQNIQSSTSPYNTEVGRLAQYRSSKS